MSIYSALYFAFGLGMVVDTLNDSACPQCCPEWHTVPRWGRVALLGFTWLVWPIAAAVNVASWLRGNRRRLRHEAHS
jgi:hypothetical protein